MTACVILQYDRSNESCRTVVVVILTSLFSFWMRLQIVDIQMHDSSTILVFIMTQKLVPVLRMWMTSQCSIELKNISPLNRFLLEVIEFKE